MRITYNNKHRWFKTWGVSIASERKMRVRAGELVGDHIVAEKAPFSFKLDGGGEEIRLAPFVYVKDLKDKIESILEQKERYTTHVNQFCSSSLTD